MKDLKQLLLMLLAIATLNACTKEDDINTNTEFLLLNQSISGNAWIDTNNDGLGDDPLSQARIYLGDFNLIQDLDGEKPDTLPPPYNEVLWADVDVDGNYEFASIDTFQNLGIRIYSYLPTTSISGTDEIPDGDMFEEETSGTIAVSVEIDEHDDGNNFIVELLNIDAVISGYVTIDKDKDGVYDGGEEGVRVKLSHGDGTGNPLGGSLAIAVTFTDEFGYYEFTQIPEGAYVVSYGNFVDYTVLGAFDESPDSDIVLTPPNYWIPTDVVEGEQETDNNFKVIPVWYNIQGTVLKDNDGDGVGDEALTQHRVEIYEDDGTGLPTGSFINWRQTNNEGEYSFTDLAVGSYIIIYFNQLSLQCVSGMDLSSEPGEVASPECLHITTTIIAPSYEDKDNNFVVEN